MSSLHTHTLPVMVQFTQPDLSSANARLTVDGQDITRMVQSVTFRSSVKDVPTATIEMIGIGLDITMPAGVAILVSSYPGHDLIAEPLEDGRTRWHNVKRDNA